MNAVSRQSIPFHAVLAAILGLACCASSIAAEPQGYKHEDVVERTAVVTAIDPKTRFITLKTDDDDTISVYAGPQVRNFAQIKVGDHVEAEYRVAIAAEITAPNQATTGLEPKLSVERSQPGGQPYGKITGVVTTTVQVTAVDTEANKVSFRRDDGSTETLGVKDEKARAFLKTVKPGDFVKVSYSEAVAIAVHSASKAKK